jgi:acyl dehydratase
MIEIGDYYEEKISFPKESIIKFAEVSGDFNPIHVSDHYAQLSMFGRPIVHGMLAASVFSKILGTEFPGEGTVYLAQNLKFIAPVYPDTDYYARVEVIEINRDKHNAVFTTTLEDAEKHQCILGTAKIKNINCI